MTCSNHALCWLPLLVLTTLGMPRAGHPQTLVRVASDENFRRDPNGVILGRLTSGASLSVIERQGGWVEADLEGWVWSASLAADPSGDFDVTVSVSEGENLRDAPQGRIIGRLREGALLEELERREQWVHVRRRGWIWSASVVEAAGAGTSAASPGAPSASRSSAGGEPAVSAAAAPVGYTHVGALGSPILTAPDGDTLAVAEPRSDVEVVAREGNWARVRIEGWMWMPPTEGWPAETPGEPAPLVPADLDADPESHVGRVVSWTLQYISLERAEAVRTDFFEGEPFLLSRFGGPEGRFVYVAVPPARLTEVEGLVPLERITVTARIRTGASALTGTPILDLLELEPVRGAR